MSAQLQHKYTLDEYFALELDSEERIEYYDGSVWTMSGASEAHNVIALNIGAELRTMFRGRGCRVYPSDLRVEVPAYPPYRYPDVSALCGKPDLTQMGGVDVLRNPQLIVEVLSDSTAAFDRGDKFSYYKSIGSFTEYLLVAQHRPHVSQFIKKGENFWANIDYNDLTETVKLVFADCELPLSEIYREIEFADYQNAAAEFFRDRETNR